MKLSILLVALVGVALGEQTQEQKISSKFSYDSEPFLPSQSANPQHYYPQQGQVPRQQVQNSPPRQQQYKPHPQQGQGPPRRPQVQDKLTSSEEAELEQEQEDAKPDRLQLLLQESKFQCQGKKDGYYADEGLACEVFHYCQEGGKHSWLCPNGFAFHQIHLICVPPSSDNICQKSSDYHFVNDYLYKPINQKQADTYNETLRYADRFFPEGYGGSELSINSPYYDDEESEEIQQQKRPVKQNYQQVPQVPHRFANSVPPHFQQQGRPVQQQQREVVQYPRQQQSVQARPVQVQQYQQSQQPRPQVQQIPQRYQQQQRPSSQQNYFTTPDQINIPLSQRRPAPANLFKN